VAAAWRPTPCPGTTHGGATHTGAYAFTLVPRAQDVGEYIAAQTGREWSGKLAPFAQIRLADGRAVGVTAYWNPRYWPGRRQLRAVEIGWIWLAVSAQRTGINAEAKLLLGDPGWRPGSIYDTMML
jgi:N-acetyltransferase